MGSRKYEIPTIQQSNNPTIQENAYINPSPRRQLQPQQPGSNP